MQSGIYMFKFTSGHYYIGKSENIEKRWENHRRHMQQGKHTKKVQWAYDNYGEPNYEVVWTIHQDHIDLYEDHLILALWDPNRILNATKPKAVAAETTAVLEKLLNRTVNNQPIMQMSTVQQLQVFDELYIQAKDFARRLNELNNSDEVIQKLNKLEEEVDKIKNLSWWQRVFYKPQI